MRADQLENGQLFKFVDENISILPWARMNIQWSGPVVSVYAVNKGFRVVRVAPDTEVTPWGPSPRARLQAAMKPKEQLLLPIIPKE